MQCINSNRNQEVLTRLLSTFRNPSAEFNYSLGIQIKPALESNLKIFPSASALTLDVSGADWKDSTPINQQSKVESESEY